MNLKELNSFKLSDAVTFHDKLNPKLWNGTKLRPEVREQLLKIAEDFLQELGVNDLDVNDITISGSNAAYSYTKYSDLDLHILVDMGNLPVDEVYRELFTAKKTIYNDTHDITIHKIPVELYVQDSRQPVVSLGEYSVMNDQWIKIPTKRRSDFDQTATKSKYEKLLGLIEIALKSKKYSKVKHIIDTIKRYRQAGLDKGGEFGPENLAYKMLRSQGYITKLYDLRDKLHSEILTVETMYQNIDEDEGKENNTIANKIFFARSNKTPKGWSYDHVGFITQDGKQIQMSGHKGNDVYVTNAVTDDPEFPKQNIKIVSLSKPISVPTTNSVGAENCGTFVANVLQANGVKGIDTQKIYSVFKQPNQQNVAEDKENHNSKLDEILYKLCNIVKKEIKEKTGEHAVAACIIDPDDRIVAKTSKDKHGRWIHAEHNAIDTYENKYGEVPEGSIIVTTLSPCNEYDDRTSDERFGESCTDYINSKGIKKVYCGYMDPTQDNDSRQFDIIETSDKDLNQQCKYFADTFLKKTVDEHYTMQFAAEKTPVVSPYAGIKDNQYRGGISEASGYIPSEKQKNDPRYSTALTVDVHPDSIKKNAKAFYWNTSRAGIPPTAKANGKIY